MPAVLALDGYFILIRISGTNFWRLVRSFHHFAIFPAGDPNAGLFALIVLAFGIQNARTAEFDPCAVFFAVLVNTPGAVLQNAPANLRLF